MRSFLTVCYVIGTILVYGSWAHAFDAEVPTLDVAVSDDEKTNDTEALSILESTEVHVEQSPTREWQFFLAANLDGELAQVNCRDENYLENAHYYYAQQAAFFETMETHTGESQRRPVALNAGDTLFPGALSRYLLSKTEQGAGQLLDILFQVPYEAFTLGDGELSIERSELLTIATQAQITRVPFQAANLRCHAFGGMEVLCEAVGTGPNSSYYTRIERDDAVIAVVSVLDPDLISLISPAQAKDINLLDPVEILPDIITEIRADDSISLIVVQYHLTSPSILAKAHHLAKSVQGIDLLITDRLFDEESYSADNLHPSYIVVPDTPTYIVSANSGHQGVVALQVVTEYTENDGASRVHSINIKKLEVSGTSPHEATQRKLEQAATDFCDNWGQPIASELPLAHPFDYRDLAKFVLNIMRFETKSQIALVNTYAFRNKSYFPLTGQLTLADVYTFLPYNNALVTLRIPGRVLRTLNSRLNHDVIAAGVESIDGTLLVNGRPIQDDLMYSVATNAFVAAGGDNIFVPDQLRNVTTHQVDWQEEEPTISEIVIHTVETRQFTRYGLLESALSPTENYPDLHDKFLWMLTGSLNLLYNQVNVHNPLINGDPAYTQSKLTVNPTDQINLEGRTILQADSRRHGWDNDLLLQYATARIEDEADAGFQETKDLIRYRSLYRYQGLHATYGQRWWVPNPFAELQIQSEFDPPETRDWHRFETTGIAGASFLLRPGLDFKLGFNTRREIFQPDAETTYGLHAGYKLRRINLLDVLNRPIQFESEVEYFYNDIADSNIHELRSENRLFFALFERLFFTTTFNAFLFRTDDVGAFGTNTELTIGLNYLWDTAFQRF